MFRPDPKPTPKPKAKLKFLKRTPLKYKRKKTGELDLFKIIWSERIHFCEECQRYIPEFSHYNFHHIKHKSTHSELRLVKMNIQILCGICHSEKHK